MKELDRLRKEILDVLNSYDHEKIAIATLGSHSALNILKGAKEEGFRTVCICREKERIIYESFGVADEIIEIDDYSDLLRKDLQREIADMNGILIPHGSFNAYIGKLDELKLPIFGNRELMYWETVREMQDRWLNSALSSAGLRTPRIIERPEDIDGLCIVKFPGAKGGKGYFLATGYDDFLQKSEQMLKQGLIEEKDLKEVFIQEYIVGANVYFSYFYSPVFSRVELIAVDRRYESNVDGLGRIPAEIQMKMEFSPTYTVVGNYPVVLRESLLSQVLRAGEAVVEVSKEIAYPGMVGPFCLEAVFNENAEMIVFEISARIVAGTNVGIPASPYSYILFGENMYMGKRIAREIKLALEQDMLEELIF
ncbi:ATP-utilizing enzymes of ATP-grasp superfamily (probably carboligases) [Archaeoglobus sulfaticallidus PM70-1]|uniref:5-formaminoimidazole-4-carboxamide-1-(beta)-D-ribofuranosyl 5'-monophosphate synthetase n=1 Tax=Archaeoglobus sulfaticallidus PM70-1 TaxID=387631 RepID=N0BIZ6_9EURY|nr:formate--phosphoribosylaminoimidazolecarboxamide ligase [Archaeoglobus sulfaticallidus]AGK60441.1 ATP-utilizing enzymes of ATP-grasp superfamily (probably carboligases) [Archaeoglobus sulfaticallidus PM70-1]